MKEFLASLADISSEEELLDFCRRNSLHGVPRIFADKEDQYYSFQNWFDFFSSLSYGKSEVGNYKVTAGVFKSYQHLEKYTLSGLRSLKTKLEVTTANA